MALTGLSERLQSRKVTITKDGNSTTEIYRVDGGNPYDLIDEVDPIGSIRPEVPGTKLSTITIEPIVGANPDTGVAESYSKLTYIFTPPERQQPANENDEVWEWDITSKTVHIDNIDKADNQWTFDSNTGAVGEHKTNVLGEDGDNVKGADVFRPAGSLRVTKYFSQAAVDQTFRQTLYDLANTLNDDTWQDWTKYEVLFLGARIRYNLADAEVAIEYNFLFGKGQADIKVDIWKESPTALNLPTSAYDEYTLKSPMDDGTTIYPFDFVTSKLTKRELVVSVGGHTTIPVTASEYVSVAKVYETSDFSGLSLVGP